MKILVTGGAGYLGSVLVNKLLELNYQVRVLDNLMFGGESLLPHFSNPNFDLIVGDIRNNNCLKKTLKNIDIVCHLAALVGEPACNINANLTKEINVIATKKLVDLSVKQKVKKFIYISTCSNYGITKGKADEATVLNPLTDYAKSKVQAEKIVLNKNSVNFHPTILRLGTLFGLSPRMRFNLLINAMTRDAYLNKTISIYKPYAIRPYLSVIDACCVIVKAVEAKLETSSYQIFNVVKNNLTKLELLKIVKKYFPKVKYKILNAKTGDNRDYDVSSHKLKKILKYIPTVAPSDGIRQMSEALTNGIFPNPNDDKYNIWIDNNRLNHDKQNN